MRTHVISSRFLFVCLLGLIVTLAACGQATNSQTSNSTPANSATTPTPTPALDNYGTPIAIPKTVPLRIVSLAPSISEILGALELQNRVVGVDAFTNYPASMATIKKVSSSTGINVESIVALKPDLVLSSGGLSNKYDTQLTRLGVQVVDLPSPDLAKTLDQITLVGRLTHTEDKAQSLVKRMQQQITQIQNTIKGTPAKKALLEVDNSTPGKPYVFGGGSFGDEMAQYTNVTNIFHDNKTNGGYPQVTDESVIAANPQYVILTEDPLYGGQPSAVYKRANWGNIEAVKSHQVYHINSDIMQRPGPRIVQGLRCLAQIVHPDKFSEKLPAYCAANV
ncbi:putative ABC transporter substrate-binding lipoprotein YvrC [Dictyobacter alpinus]|uniref:Putative ABC transporter substrate-binding lipoprotein YvrC n=1 Tax=Dictyobacter alpinus TaxID=2014873 RepID=A0A402B123_9CHLR|nr:ABC transporter substrate-binding protein [Dictyobacter alpinus]GCE25038.1 putative ABC transporter substrate-binding lipoprotein YvrC [Dictyobacter alpinus]